jgi:homoserine O-acetyltransferase/O-succinyltransferase
MNTCQIGEMRLACGELLPDVELAYVARGHLAPDGRNAVLVTHGYTSGPSMLSPGHHTAEGSWAPLLGPGRPLDTDRHFIVCSNMLGSAFGSTGPSHTNPATGKPWGPTFPRITLEDIVAAQHRLLHRLGVRHLQAVVGPSYGGFQALQWAVSHPDMVSACGAVVSGPYSPPGLDAASAAAKYADHPDWHGGWHYEHPGLRQRLFEQRQQTMRHYGLERLYEDRYPDPAERRRRMDEGCRTWADRFDPNSMVVLAGAAAGFDLRDRLAEISARLLLVQCTTDAIFPPDPATQARLAEAKGPVRYTVIDSPYGHMAPGIEWQRLEAELRWLLPT